MAVRTATAELTARERSEPRWSVRRVIPAFVWLWVVTRLLLLVISLNPRLYSSGVYGDVRAYGAKVERMFQGELPYRDVAIEYPPGSVPFTLMPALVVGTGAGYRMAFALEMILVDALGLYAAWRLARAADRGRRRPRSAMEPRPSSSPPCSLPCWCSGWCRPRDGGGRCGAPCRRSWSPSLSPWSPR